MDMNLNLFFLEDCFKPTNGYSYLHNSLNSLLEHKTFSLKGRNEIQSVITFINTKLNSHSERAQGLHLLKVFLPQCSDDVFVDNCVSWMQQCVRTCSGSRENGIISLAYEVLGNLFQYSGMIQELTKPVSGSVIPKFLELVHHVSSNLQSRTENTTYLLCCLEFVMRNYGGSCGPHKSNIEQFLMKFVDHPDKQTVHLVARCVAVLPLVGGGGVLNVNHKNSWEILQKKIVLHLQETLDALFEGVPEVQLFQSVERTGTEKLLIPLIEENDPFLRIQRLAVRFINLSCFLQELLVHELPVAKRVMPQLFINLFMRGFAVNSNTVSKHITADKLIVGCLIPQMHVAMFKLLGALIICCGQNLLEYGSLICRFVLQTLKWTSYDKHWPHGTERPYGQLRKEAYNTLILWLKVAKAGSCVEISSPDELIGFLLDDVKISHTAVTLSAAKARGRHLTKQQRKQLKLGQDSSTSSSEPSWSRAKLYDETANHDTCTAALKTLQWIIQTAGPFLKPTLHKIIQEELLKILLKIGRGEIFAPYSDWKCRLELYQLLHALVLWPHCSWPPPLQFALQLMRVGLLDPCVKVASFCSQSLNNLVKLVHPVSRPLHFPPSGDDMQEVIRLENSHKNKILFIESMDTDKSYTSPKEDIGLPQSSNSPKQVYNASENRLHENDTSNAQNISDIEILERETTQGKKCCTSDNNGTVLSNHVSSFKDRSLNSDESSNNAMDFETDDSKSFQQSRNIVTGKRYCEQHDSELENQNNHNITLHSKLHNSENELQGKPVEVTDDSCISSLHPVAKKQKANEKYETVQRNSLPEELEVTGPGGEDEHVEKEKGKEEDNDDENCGDRSEPGSKADEDDDEDDDDNDDDDDDDDDDEDKMESAFLGHTKESSIKNQVNLKIPDEIVEKPVVRKAPISPNNYSISYLYDQSSDSSDSEIETASVTFPVSFESNEVDKENLKEVNSLANLNSVETGADEHSRTSMKNENEVVHNETNPITVSQKSINDMCEEKQSSENLLDSTDNSNVADAVPDHKVLSVDLCSPVADTEDSEVDVITICGVPEETEKEIIEPTDKMEVTNVLDERTVKHKDINGETQKEYDTKNEKSSFMDIAEVKETTTLPEETEVPTKVHCDNDGNSASEVKDDQCISGQVEEIEVSMNNYGNSASEVQGDQCISGQVEETEIPKKVHCDNDGNSASEVKGDQCISDQVEDRSITHSNNKNTELVDKIDATEHNKEIQFERECKTELCVEITGKELQFRDKNQDASSEQTIKICTSVSPNGLESMPEIDSHSVEKEVDKVCMNAVATDTSAEKEKIDVENVTEPLTKKRKLESCVPETESNCQQ